MSSPDPEETLGSVSCNAHRQRFILRAGNTQIHNDNDDTKKGEDGADDIHADAGIHLKDIKGGERGAKVFKAQHLGRLRMQDKMGAGQKGEDQAGWGRSLLIYPRIVR